MARKKVFRDARHTVTRLVTFGARSVTPRVEPDASWPKICGRKPDGVDEGGLGWALEGLTSN